MRDILKKVTTGSMIAGAALLVAACGGDSEANNTEATDLGNVEDMNIDTGIDMNGTDMNTMDMNVTDMNATTTTDMNTTTTTTTETNTGQ